MRGIWIYAAKKTTNHGRDHPFVVCQVMSQKYGILVYLAKPRAQFERSLVRTSDMPKQKCCLFSSVRTPDIPQQQNQLPGCFLVLQHHFFLSLPRPSLEKRTVDARGVRGIWIYAAKRTTNHGRDHPFVICQVMSQKYGILVYLAKPRAQFERSLVRTSDMPKQKCCLFSSVRTPDITQQQNQLPGCFLVLQRHFFLKVSFSASTLLRKKDSRCKGGERDMDICRQKDHKPWSRPSFCGLSGYELKIWHPGLLGRASCTIRAVPGSNLGHAKNKMLSFLPGRF